MNNIILITGASGSGKTTVCKYLAEKYQVFHFDNIGVPAIDEMISKHGSRESWQEWATETWIEKLSSIKGDEIMILEGSFNPEFASIRICEERSSPKNGLAHYAGNCESGKIALLCLHSDRATREKRLIKYRNQPELATQDMENFANVLREKTIALGGVVIDSSGDIHETVKACLLAIEGKESLRIEVPIEVARRLIEEQFTEYSHLEIKPVEFSGWDNATFHLGDEMLIRLPRGEAYALKVPKEHSLITKLGKQLLIPIPKPVAMGRPSKDYPWNWSIYKYLEGESANSIELSDADLENIAYELANFLNELHKIDTKGTPFPGLHNYWRGEHFTVYECGALKYFKDLRDIINSDKVIKLWEKAAATKWEKPPVWIHGDLAPENFLIKDGSLSAVIDFGGCSIGDPACDLVIAFTFFKGKSREIFKKQVNLDENTWLRAKAWALWKAGFELTHIEDKSSSKAIEQIRIINEVLNDE